MTDALRKVIRVGHSPDPDDAFMFYAMTKGKLREDGLRFEHVLEDIETLNQWALEGRLEVTVFWCPSVTRFAMATLFSAVFARSLSSDTQYPVAIPLKLEMKCGVRHWAR